jgi:uracil-DNA glycosylase
MKADWHDYLKDEMAKPYFKALMGFVEAEYASQTIYPPRERLYTAFDLTGYGETKALILGQDPYHGAGQSHGLCFSVANPDVKFPPSLRNIFKELHTDLGIQRTNRNLSDWARQGVLLLNTVLTVRAGQAGSHRGKGWETFTDSVISLLNAREKPVIFVLWGNDAKKKLPLITNPQHHVIMSAHPSPLSAHTGFFGSKPFSRINGILRATGENEIVWGP